jgi:Tfp pilus assembly protein PilV
MKNPNSHNNTRGQSLAEIVVTIGIVALLVTGVVAATTTSLRNNQAGRVRSLAVQFAQEGIELTRELRGAGWSDFQVYSGLWCLDKNGIWTQAVGSCAPNIDGTFTRSVTFTWNATDERMEVAVTVAWNDSGIPRSTTIETYLTNWK